MINVSTNTITSVQQYNIKDFFLVYSMYLTPIITGLIGAYIGVFVTLRLERYKRKKDCNIKYLEEIEKLVDTVVETHSAASINISLKSLPDLTQPMLELTTQMYAVLPSLYKTGDKKLARMLVKFLFNTIAVLEAIESFLFKNKLISNDIFDSRHSFFREFKLSTHPKVRIYYEKLVIKHQRFLNKNYSKYKEEKTVILDSVNNNLKQTFNIYKRLILLKI